MVVVLVLHDTYTHVYHTRMNGSGVTTIHKL